jgi:hypothetical protein
MNHINTYERIKKDFCHIFSFKSHGDTLEIVTPFTTLTDKFVSVFVTQRNQKLIITDGGLIGQNLYENNISPEDPEIVDYVSEQYKKFYNIQETSNKIEIYYFRSIQKIELLSAAVFDLVNFIVGTVNSMTVQYKRKKILDEKDRFVSETNNFLKENYQQNFKSNREIVKGLRFNGVITHNGGLTLIEYISGHSSKYLEKDFTKAIVNFQLIKEINYNINIKNKIALINDKSIGYKNGVPVILSNHLSKFSNTIIKRTQQEELLQIISNN